MVLIKFIKQWKDIAPGEIMKTTEPGASETVKNGFAEYVDEPKKKKVKTPTIKKKKVEPKKEKVIKQSIPIVEQFAEKIQSYTNKRNLIQQFLKINPIYYDSSKTWWIWDHNKFMWLLIDETDVINAINKKTTINTLNSKEKNEMLEGLKQEGRLIAPKNLPKTWVQFKNKIIDIETDEWIYASPEYFATNPIPFELSNEDSTPIMDKIFEEWVGKEYVETLYEIISYCLIPSYPIHRLFCFIGSGLNGKSKFLELVSRFIGQSNIATSELDSLLMSRFEITRLHKKLVCLMGETNFNEMKKTAVLKKLTGGDLIGFEYKNKNPFQDYNYAKILISTNNLPATTDKTIGFYRRWMIIDFPNTFDEQKDILSDIPLQEYNNLTKKCMIILKKLLKTRTFTNEGNIEERIKKFEDRSNPFDKFFNENIHENFDTNIPKFEFKKRLDDWCKENNFREITETSIAKKMKDFGINTVQITADWFTTDGLKPRIRAWNGINFKSTAQGAQPTQAL